MFPQYDPTISTPIVISHREVDYLELRARLYGRATERRMGPSIRAIGSTTVTNTNAIYAVLYAIDPESMSIAELHYAGLMLRHLDALTSFRHSLKLAEEVTRYCSVHELDPDAHPGWTEGYSHFMAAYAPRLEPPAETRATVATPAPQSRTFDLGLEL